MKYISVEDCKDKVFPFIHEHLSKTEPAPAYEKYKGGLEQLHKVLSLVQDDQYYPSFHDKCAYLLCSIATAQYFPNGNKRLAVAVLIQFLIVNNVEILILSREEYQRLMAFYFPHHAWENNENIRDEHPLFLYNLTILIGSPENQSKPRDFDLLKQSVAEMFEILYRV